MSCDCGGRWIGEKKSVERTPHELNHCCPCTASNSKPVHSTLARDSTGCAAGMESHFLGVEKSQRSIRGKTTLKTSFHRTARLSQGIISISQIAYELERLLEEVVELLPVAIERIELLQHTVVAETITSEQFAHVRPVLLFDMGVVILPARPASRKVDGVTTMMKVAYQ